MNELLTDFTSLHWWISVVIVGVLVELASSYLQSHAPKALLRLRAKWLATAERARAEREEQIARFREDAQERTNAKLQSIHDLLVSIVLLILFLGIAAATYGLQAPLLLVGPTPPRAVLWTLTVVPMFIGSAAGVRASVLVIRAVSLWWRIVAAERTVESMDNSETQQEGPADD